MMYLNEQTIDMVSKVLSVKRMIAWTHSGWYAPQMFYTPDGLCCIMMYKYIADWNAVESHARQCASVNNLAEPERFDARPVNGSKFTFIV